MQLWDRAFRRRENLVNLREFRSVAVFCVRGKQWILSCVCWHLLCLMGCASQGLLGDARPYLVNLPVPVQWAKLLEQVGRRHDDHKSHTQISIKSVSITWLHVGTVRSRRFCSCLVSDVSDARFVIKPFWNLLNSILVVDCFAGCFGWEFNDHEIHLHGSLFNRLTC